MIIYFLCVSLMKMISLLRDFVGGLIQLNMGKPRPLEYVAHASFLASLFADYLNSTGVPGWYCGPTFVSTQVLKDFAKSQVRINLVFHIHIAHMLPIFAVYVDT